MRFLILTFAQLVATLPPGLTTTPWDKGIQPISAESYWNAVACGQEGGDMPSCLFPDLGLCQRGDYTLSLFTPYKLVAHQVWSAARMFQPIPTPDYGEAERQQVTLSVMPKTKTASNAVRAVVIKRAGSTTSPISQSDGEMDGTKRFIFGFEPFAPTADIAIVLVGPFRTVECSVPATVLSAYR